MGLVEGFRDAIASIPGFKTASSARASLGMKTTFTVAGGKASVVRLKDELVVEVQRAAFLPRPAYSKKATAIAYRDIVAVNALDSLGVDAAGSGCRRLWGGGGGDGRRRLGELAAASGAEGPGDTLVIHYVRRHKKKADVWSCRSLVLGHPDCELVSKWRKLLLMHADRFAAARPRRLLVFVNPYGGRRNADAVWRRRVKPIFDVARIECEVVRTERANHAFDLLQRRELAGVDGVVCVGGDGMFNELFNALIRRAARDRGVDVGDPELARLPAPAVRLGVIPAGSTDAIAVAFHGTEDVETAALHVVMGDRRDVDVAAVYADKELQRFSMTMASYGYFGDTLLRSENYRWLGPRRYEVAGAATILANRAYEGRIDYVEDVRGITSPRSSAACCDSCAVCAAFAAANAAASAPAAAETEEKTIQGKFLAVTGASLSCANSRTPKGVSPTAHLGDGHTDLIVVRKTGRFNFFRYIIRTGLHRDNPFDLSFVEVHRVKEFSFTQRRKDGRNGSTERQSVWNCDGEILRKTDIRVRIHCQTVPVFARGPARKGVPVEDARLIDRHQSLAPILVDSDVSSLSDEVDERSARQ